MGFFLIVVRHGFHVMSANVRPDELMAYLVLSLPASAHPGRYWSQPLAGRSAGDLMHFGPDDFPICLMCTSSTAD